MASSTEQEAAGNDAYRDDHMGAIFREGFSFSGYERDYVGLNLGGDASTGPPEVDGAPRYLAISGITGVDSISDGRGAAFADFDNDGWEDLYTPNGFVSGKSMKDT